MTVLRIPAPAKPFLKSECGQLWRKDVISWPVGFWYEACIFKKADANDRRQAEEFNKRRMIHIPLRRNHDFKTSTHATHENQLAKNP
tara:strand:- start:1434 stop:1694 length:261 start_codon:yes stop_codon:yes gene_type:complete